MSKDYLPVRLSHLLRHCSVGAIVRGPDYLMTVQDIRQWTTRGGSDAERIIPYVEQVKAALGIDQELRAPPTAREPDTGKVDGVSIPAMRFPTWMKCPSCGLLHAKPWRGLQSGKAARCLEPDRKKCSGGPEIEQVPWVLVHESGYMADVPWHFLAHAEANSREQKQCRADWSASYIRLIKENSSSRTLRCERCSAKARFDDSMRIPYGKTRQQPWSEEEAATSEDLALILEVNDARVYSPSTRNALVIPPESRIRKGEAVDRLYSSSHKRCQIEQARTPLARKGTLKTIARELHCSPAQVEEALEEIERGYPLYGKNITQGLLLESEYQALVDEIPDLGNDEDFVTRHRTLAWKAMRTDSKIEPKLRKLINAVEQLIAVDRLKEIMVMTGFQRLGGKLVPPDIVGKSIWLPALELYGEGIFLSLSAEKVRKWEVSPSVVRRAEDFQRRFGNTWLHFDPEVTVTPRFLLLHTLSHLLIRQLEMEAGYPAASLKERIYCTSGGSRSMAGILVYVAVPDVVGSLGGLAELATPERFLRLLSGVFDHAEWCSLDPVCAEHEGQGPGLLNRAACHACALVPEPSCVCGNVLLDRTFIKGEPATGIPPFLDFDD